MAGTKNHPWCSSSPRGWHGHGHSTGNPAAVTLDYDYFLPSGDCIPANTPHLQWETLNFGWWSWVDKQGKTRLAKY